MRDRLRCYSGPPSRTRDAQARLLVLDAPVYVLAEHLPLLYNFALLHARRPTHLFFFFKDPAPPELSPLPLPDPLRIPPWQPRRARGRARSSASSPARPGRTSRSPRSREGLLRPRWARPAAPVPGAPRRPRAASGARQDRKSTRLNSSHSQISYAVFCLK